MGSAAWPKALNDFLSLTPWFGFLFTESEELSAIKPGKPWEVLNFCSCVQGVLPSSDLLSISCKFMWQCAF